MSAAIAAVLESVKTWDVKSQVELVHQIESLWTDDEGEISDDEVDALRNDAEFIAELERRSREIDNGTMQTVNWSESRKRILASVGLTEHE